MRRQRREEGEIHFTLTSTHTNLKRGVRVDKQCPTATHTFYDNAVGSGMATTGNSRSGAVYMKMTESTTENCKHFGHAFPK